MVYRLQIAKDNHGANYNDKGNSEQQLNLINDFEEPLDMKLIISSLINHISNCQFLPFYTQRLKKIQSTDNYKVLIIGVGRHHGNDIFLMDDDRSQGEEVAHVDEEKLGQLIKMNRLYIFDKKPTKLIFKNTCLNKEEIFSELTFKDKHEILICNF